MAMKITLNKPLFFQGQGRRDYQQDRYRIDDNGRFFIVCVGMGGHEDVDIAAQTVCCALAVYFDTNPPENYIITTDYFDKAVLFAYNELDKKEKNPKSLLSMGTTMTCVYIGDNGVLVAHTGDSRVYQIRPKYYIPLNYQPSVIMETKDHSLVQELLDKGKITEQQAKSYPKRNIITKCMSANDERDMPDYNSNSVLDGDYFFLCTDGVLENISTECLCRVLAMKGTDDDKINKLFSYCEGKTSDNFTAVLIHITDGYLPPINLNSTVLNNPQIQQPSYDPEKTKSLINKISDYLERFKRR